MKVVPNRAYARIAFALYGLAILLVLPVESMAQVPPQAAQIAAQAQAQPQAQALDPQILRRIRILAAQSGRLQLPDLTRHNRNEVSRALEMLGLRFETQEKFACGHEPSLAYLQDPVAGANVALGSTVTVTFEPEARSFPIPDFSTDMQQTAIDRLAKYNLCPGSTSYEAGPGIVGNVLRQDPQAGQPVRSGDLVNLVIRTALPQPDPVTLQVTPLDASPSHNFQFVANTTAKPGLEYQFDFGDGEPGPWIAESTAQHRYQNAGHFNARVNARIGEATVASEPVGIDINEQTQAPALRVDLDVTPTKGTLQDSYLFTAKSNGPPGTEYKFYFGDGEETEWITDNSTQHRYTHLATFEVKAAVRSKKQQSDSRYSDVVVGPSEPPAPTFPPSWPVIVVALGAAAGTGFAGYQMRLRRIRTLPKELSFKPHGSAPRPSIHTDAGRVVAGHVELRGVRSIARVAIEMSKALVARSRRRP